MGLLHRDGLPPGIHDKDGAGHSGHVLHAAEILIQLQPLPVQEKTLLFRIEFESVLFLTPLQLLQTTNLVTDRLEVGEHPSQPSLGNEEAIGSGGFLLDDASKLALGANEKHPLTLEDHFTDRLLGTIEPVQRLSEVDDVDAVSSREDESLHLRIPTAGLVSEVDACLEQFV